MGKDYCMDWTVIIYIAIAILVLTPLLLLLYNNYISSKEKKSLEDGYQPDDGPKNPNLSEGQSALAPVNTGSQERAVISNSLSELEKKLDKLPGKVLDSITSSSNNQKGRLGELIGYLQLNAQYDKLVPWSDVTDFIGIRWPTKTDPGTIDFIDIKNGPNARLTRDQNKLKKIVNAKQVHFVKIKVNTTVQK